MESIGYAFLFFIFNKTLEHKAQFLNYSKSIKHANHLKIIRRRTSLKTYSNYYERTFFLRIYYVVALVCSRKRNFHSFAISFEWVMIAKLSLNTRNRASIAYATITSLKRFTYDCN